MSTALERPADIHAAGGKVPVVEVEGVSVSIGGKIILDDISFSVGRGEFFSIIGPNGAGKSTLLKAMARIIGGWRGSISLGGVPLKRRTPREQARLMAYVPQAASFDLPFTSLEFVLMGRYPHLSPFTMVRGADMEKAAEAMAITGTSPFADRSMATLSGGERQKVFIAAALCQDAGILLLDEPTTFLDPRHHDEIHETLCRVNREKGTTVIFVTHDLNAAVSPPVTGVLALRGGRRRYFGAPDGLTGGDALNGIYEKDFVVAPHPVTGRPYIFS